MVQPQIPNRVVARLHAVALKQLPLLATRVTLEAFTSAVEQSVAHRFRDRTPGPETVAKYLGTLRAADLCVAVACAEGDEAVWEHVILTYRPILYRSARVLAGNEETARELADALWAELYGVGHTRASLEANSEVRSLFRYFHGRSTLATWLRSVLSQRYVDIVRTHQRTEPLETRTQTDGPRDGVSASDLDVTMEAADPDRSRYVAHFQAALKAALTELEPRDRLRLACYYTQELTLAETGRVLKEHEATVSRKLTKTRKQVRTAVEKRLQRTGLGRAAIELCYEYVMEDRSVDLSQVLDQ